MRKFISLFLFISLLTGCSAARPQAPRAPAASAVPSTQCAWNWATQALPDLSATIAAGLQAAGLKGLTIRAEAYGENCLGATGKVESFAAVQTDFHITARVASLTDKDDLGNLLEKILGVLDAFPTGKVPGPQPGLINVSFQTGNAELNVMFSVTAGRSARAHGMHGSQLLGELQKH